MSTREEIPAKRNHVCGRVLVVDDSDAFLRAAAAVVSAADGLHHVGSVRSGEEAIRSLAQLKPDLVLLDIHLPGIDGVETARIIRREAPEAVVILLSANPDGFEAPGLAAGATALLDKCDLRARALDELWLEHRPAAR